MQLASLPSDALSSASASDLGQRQQKNTQASIQTAVTILLPLCFGGDLQDRRNIKMLLSFQFHNTPKKQTLLASSSYMGACDIHAATGHKDSGHSLTIYEQLCTQANTFLLRAMRAGHFLLLVWRLLATVTNSRKCVIHNCSSSALCLLTFVSHVALSPHHCV